MEQGRWVELCLEVVGGLRGEPDVAHVQGGGRGVTRDIDHAQRREHDRRHDDRGRDDHQRGGQQPPRTASVEGRQVDPAGRLQLAHDQAGDEEARHDVEDVDPDVAPGQARDPCVVGKDQEDGDRAQAFDVGSERPGAFRRGRCHGEEW